jgi:hypothetical protein
VVRACDGSLTKLIIRSPAASRSNNDSEISCADDAPALVIIAQFLAATKTALGIKRFALRTPWPKFWDQKLPLGSHLYDCGRDKVLNINPLKVYNAGSSLKQKHFELHT